jgi:hypothetical protein
VRSALFAVILVSLLGTFGTDKAAACSIVWDESYSLRVHDVVVWGTYVPAERRGEGIIKVTRRIKGPKSSEIPVRWNPDYVSDGADCGQWEPDMKHPHGRFFLRDKGDGTYIVDSQTPRQKANS